ncbi:hypothetical protein AVEN_60101-1 [Araneus ventricosus]|uniref:Uncharacterized protein n=1 Tax=Araneus ventricosus TaxID=182803 RepID=A0A4Y2J7Z1_ARAVE|nr:hypothetical protein AVEN_60101-1 [Araneus ventricosus]
MEVRSGCADSVAILTTVRGRGGLVIKFRFGAGAFQVRDQIPLKIRRVLCQVLIPRGSEVLLMVGMEVRSENADLVAILTTVRGRGGRVIKFRFGAGAFQEMGVGAPSPPQSCLSSIRHGLALADLCDECPELTWISEGVRKESCSSI